MMKIPYVNLKKQWEEEKDLLLPQLESVFESGHYIGGEEIEKLENNLANYCNVKYCVSLNSGTDALMLGLIAIGIKKGDEVITPPNSFIASTSSIIHIGANPVFVDVLDDQNIDTSRIEKAITNKTKAIMPVHLTGRVANMKKLKELSEKYSIPIIEDAAQSIGSKFNNQMSGSFGKVGCFSAHPLKNLNALGDSGFLTTDDEKIYNFVKSIRNHGLIDRNTVELFGLVSRMDVIQAKVLNFRLKKLDELIQKRRENAKLYFELLNKKYIKLPYEKENEYNTYHTFVIQVENRNELKKYLYEKGIETAIHYPIPIHLQPASNKLNYKKGDFPNTEFQAEKILTLPINQYLKKEEIAYISNEINNFYGD